MMKRAHRGGLIPCILAVALNKNYLEVYSSRYSKQELGHECLAEWQPHECQTFTLVVSVIRITASLQMRFRAPLYRCKNTALMRGFPLDTR